MTEAVSNQKVYVKTSPVHGLGVYAKENIEKGDVVEICPLLVLPYIEGAALLENYYFHWDDECFALPLGYGLIYNHAERPNAEWERDMLNRTMVFRALYFIPKHEEIFVFYGKEWFDERALAARGPMIKMSDQAAKLTLIGFFIAMIFTFIFL